MTHSEAATAIPKTSTGYEKDIRDIVEYFEASCRMSRPRGGHLRLQKYHRSKQTEANKDDIRLPRSQKIESLIKRVVEKESRERMRKSPCTSGQQQQQQQQRLQICDGIVRSKLQVFDETKRPSRLPLDHKGFVKARLAIFDNTKTSSAVSSTTGNAKRLAEKRLLALANASKTKSHIVPPKRV